MSSTDLHDRDYLQRQLVKLGDMMGDGLHHEPDGKWIIKEYRNICRALGYTQNKKKNPANAVQINERMTIRCNEVKCIKCGGELKQTRLGSMRARCTLCGAKFTLLTRAKSKSSTQGGKL